MTATALPGVLAGVGPRTRTTQTHCPYCSLQCGVTMTAGASVPRGSIVGAGAVVPKALVETERLYVGVPAKPVADLTGSAHQNRADPKFARVTSS